MKSIGLTTAMLLVLAAPALAQTNAGSAAEGAARVAPEVTPQAAPSDTNLPGVTDSGTTGSTTGTATGAASGQTGPERCQTPGMTSDSNPSGGVPTVSEADPACR